MQKYNQEAYEEKNLKIEENWFFSDWINLVANQLPLTADSVGQDILALLLTQVTNKQPNFMAFPTVDSAPALFSTPEAQPLGNHWNLVKKIECFTFYSPAS
ncbi:hypothetical protein BDZ97DRAFT_1762197 [Flammula alnicola]|nr:hypothetical protein BDZ97DRAFT_1762197 [Flammula alnicola]